MNQSFSLEWAHVKQFVDEVKPPQLSQLPPPSFTRISKVDFELFKPSDIAKLSTVEITVRNLKVFGTSTPYPNGVLDPALGPIGKSDLCASCGLKLEYCIGHFGHIVLKLPVFHIGYFKDTIKTLQAICKSCSRVLLDDAFKLQTSKMLNQPGMTRQIKIRMRAMLLEKAKKNKLCPHCGFQNGTIKKLSTAFKIVHVFDAKNKRADEERELSMKEYDFVVANNKQIKDHIKQPLHDIDPLAARKLLQAVPDEDCQFLGFNKSVCRPEDMIISILPVL
jgi:DNA-directed RNA polymerase III subunit RPC1